MLLTALLFALPLSALAEGNVPKPRLRPAETPGAERHETAIPMPKLRPAPAPEAAPPPAPPAAEGDPSGTSPDKEPGVWSAAAIEDARRACRGLLDGLDLEYDLLDPIGEPGGCGAPAPVSVRRVAGVALTPAATLTCGMAAALHGWISVTVKPAARTRLRTEVTEIRGGTSYACRRRNNASSGKLSEHGKANALDMAGFGFEADGKDVAVGGGNWGEGILASLGLSRGGSFLDDIRAGACEYFTTVLGPGSDPHHGDHFHVDVLQRKGGYRICQ